LEEDVNNVNKLLSKWPQFSHLDLKKMHFFTKYNLMISKPIPFTSGGCRGSDRMVVGFSTTYAIRAYHHWCCEFES